MAAVLMAIDATALGRSGGRYLVDPEARWDQAMAEGLFYVRGVRLRHARPQERFGYPELTPEVKGKILGLNALRLYGIGPVTTKVSESDLKEARLSHPVANLTWGPRTAAEVRAYRAHHQGWP